MRHAACATHFEPPSTRPGVGVASQREPLAAPSGRPGVGVASHRELDPAALPSRPGVGAASQRLTEVVPVTRPGVGVASHLLPSETRPGVGVVSHLLLPTAGALPAQRETTKPRNVRVTDLQS